MSVPAELQSNPTTGENKTPDTGGKKKRIYLNAFDMFSVSHLSPGQWKRKGDQNATKRNLDYWINLAKLLDRGGFDMLFLADTYGGYDTYQGSLDECIRRGAQWPVLDPIIPISAMAAVTKNLTFGVTASTSFEPPFLLAKRLSTLDHLTKGRVAWNIVTSWKKAAFKAIGLDSPVEHDQRYAIADEYMDVVYKLWESSWSDEAIEEDVDNDTYANPDKVRQINHHGKFFSLETRHIVDPSPQRTPLLFQAGTSSTGSGFAAKHAEAVFVTGQSASALRPKVDNVRSLAKAQGRDPDSVKFFATYVPIIGRTEDEAQAKYQEFRKHASVIGALVLFSGQTGVDASNIPLDEVLTAEHSSSENKVQSELYNLLTGGADTSGSTLRSVTEKVAIGVLAPVVVGSPTTVADTLQTFAEESGVDGFNLIHVTSPGSFEDVVEFLIPELRRRGVYPEPAAEDEQLTARERIYGPGQSRLRDDHPGSQFKYDAYQEE